MSKLIHTVLGSRAGYGLTVLRIFVGSSLLPTVRKSFLDGLAVVVWPVRRNESVGLAPGTLMAAMAGGTEFLGGLISFFSKRVASSMAHEFSYHNIRSS